jgi:hypothetical protein
MKPSGVMRNLPRDLCVKTGAGPNRCMKTEPFRLCAGDERSFSERGEPGGMIERHE